MAALPSVLNGSEEVNQDSDGIWLYCASCQEKSNPNMTDNVKKRLYRQRAHANPFKDTNIDIPRDPESIDWKKYFKIDMRPDFIDIGCGYGKFLLKVAEKVPHHNILGIEIRDKVYSYAKAMVEKADAPNAGVMRTNALIFLQNIFRGSQLSKIFILFPDPHFKKRKQKGRVVCPQMMEMYEYLLQDHGRIYISTDVKVLFDDMVEIILSNKAFRPLDEEEMDQDELFPMIAKDTDEALRAGVKTGSVFSRVFEMNKKH